MVKLVQAVVVGLLMAVAFAGSVKGDTVLADFRRDYVVSAAPGQTRAATRNDGWDYQWNASAAIGTAAGNYRSLVWSEASHVYAPQNAKLPGDEPAGYLSVTSDGGHPGHGSQQAGNAVDRFVIAAYTIKKGQEGSIRIADSLVRLNTTPLDNNGFGTGVEIRVYVNDKLIANFIFVATDDRPISFNRPLGSLKAGDTVYVAIGPNKDAFCDSFNLEYKLVRLRGF